MAGRINWKALRKRIPIKIWTSDKISFDIVFVKDFADGKTLGETRFNPNQIALQLDHPPKETVSTYLHEVLHAISDTYKVGLTEAQVLALEKALPLILKPGNLFDGDEHV